MEDQERYRRKVIESLRLLSLDYDDQITIFPDFVDSPFEVLDTFHNAFLLLPTLIENKEFNFCGIANLLRIKFLIDSMLNMDDFDTLKDEMFREMDDWQLIRSVAEETLLYLDEEVIKPDLEYI